MRIRFLTVVVSSLLSVLILGAAAAGFAYWKIMHGPVSLNFLSGKIETEISKSLGGLGVELTGAVVERDAATGRAVVRLENVRLIDASGRTVAKAPQAEVTVEGAPLLQGQFVPLSFELIGPRIEFRRTLAGTVELGFAGGSSAGESGAKPAQGGKADRLDNSASGANQTDVAPGAELIDLLSGQTPGGGALATLTDIKVSNASIALYDEANQSAWNAPKADLVFKRMPYGFAIAATAEIASGKTPWHTEITANYRRESRDFALAVRVLNLIPADIADDVSALSQLAQVQLPLSGDIEALIDQTGRITSASGSFSAGAGRLSLPGYIADPIEVDQGSLVLQYQPKTGGVVISKAALLIGSSRAEITGAVDPVTRADGKVEALKITLAARDVSIDTQGNQRNLLAIDRVAFSGIASTRSAKLDITNLEVASGNASVKLHGVIEVGQGGSASPGIAITGAVRNLPAALLKRLWPPIVAPNTRKWVNNNVKSGTVTSSTFKVNFAPGEIAKAQKQKRLPDDAIDLSFELTGVSASYFQDLPTIRNASGSGRLHGNSFDLTWQDGAVNMPSGKTIALKKGSMKATGLLADVTPAVFDIDLTGQIQAGFEFINLPALNLLKKSGFDTGRLTGATSVNLNLAIPLQSVVPRDKVKVTLEGKLADAAMKDAGGDMDLTGGSIDFTVKDGVISGNGPVKLNGIAAALKFTRADGDDGQTAVIEAELDDKERLKLGVNINDFVRGPVRVKVTVPEAGAGISKLKVEADLSKAELRLDVISWSRPPGQKSSVTFEFIQTKGKPAQIKNLALKSGEVALEGDFVLARDGGIAEARLSKVYLDDENRFAVSLRRTEGEMTVTIDGKSFDARPMIKQMFSSKTTAGVPAKRAQGELEFVVDANIDRVYANRGEVIAGVHGNLRTRGGSVILADIRGNFLSGHPIALKIAPAGDGSRCLTVRGRDAGAAIRSANLYSKIAGGQIELDINFERGTGFVKSGILVLRQFEVRNEAALAQLDNRAKPKRSGPRADGLAFRKIVLPFTTDAKFIRINDAYARGNELCADARGLIRKSDVAMDLTGNIVPVCALNDIIGDIPLLNILFPNGVLGLTYVLGGTMGKPAFQFNPVSLLAPGFLRKLFEFEGPRNKRLSNSCG